MPFRGGARGGGRSLFSGGVPGGNTGIQGTARLAGGTVVPGGKAEILNSTGTQLLYTPVIDGSGNFAQTGMTAGTYRVRYGSPGTHSQERGQSPYFTVTVTNGAMTTQDFVAVAALYWDDFQRYTLSSQFTSGGVSAGNIFDTLPNGAISSISFGQGGSAANIALNPTGGPSGEKTMRYTIPIGFNGQTVQVSPRISPIPVGIRGTEFGVRWMSKVSTGFDSSGNGASSGNEFKWFLWKLGPTAGGNTPQIGVYLEQTAPGGATSVKFDVTDKRGNGFNVGAGQHQPAGSSITTVALGAAGAWEIWHVWAIYAYNLCGNNAVFELWLDGDMIFQWTGPFLTSQADIGTDAADMLIYEPGSNINHGPDHSETRDFRELGFYLGKPPTYAGLAA